MRRPFWIALAGMLALAVTAWLVWPRGTSSRTIAPAAPATPVIQASPALTATADEARSAPPLASAADPVTAMTAIRVRDRAGLPIAGAEGFAVSLDESRELGVTAADGNLLAARAELAARTLVIRHRRHATAEVAVPDPAPAELVVVLGPGGTLRGTVRVEASGEPAPGVWVLAERPRRVSTCATLQQLRPNNPAVPRARADATGYFEITGLDPERRYSLYAGGAGFLAAGDAVESATDAGEIALTVRPLYALAVVLRDSYGGPLRTNASMLRLSYDCLDSAARHPQTGSMLDSWLAGLALDCEEIERDGFTVVFTTPDLRESLWRIAFEANLPGYAPLRTVLHAPRASDPVARQELALERSVDRWGSLDVRFDGAPANVRVPPGVREFPYRIRLLDAQGAESTLALRNGPVRTTLDGIPAGRYSAWFRCAAYGRYPPDERGLPLEIGEEPATLAIDLSGFGALRLSGMAEVGPLVVRLRALDRGGIDHVTLDGPPYELACIAAGRYSISARADTTFERFGEERLAGEVLIVPGELREVVLER